MIQNPGVKPSSNNCWNCGYKINKQISLFGVCSYFELKKLEPKEIPSNIVDIGCKNWASIKGAYTIKMIIEVFDGEILEDKSQYKKEYKRKIITNKKKYNKRKDWE